MLKNKSNRIRFFMFFLIIASIVTSICSMKVYGSSHDSEYEYNILDANIPQGYNLVRRVDSEWESATAESRIKYYIFTTNKPAETKRLTSIKAKHTKGTTTRVTLGVDYLTEDETLRQFGGEVEAKIGVVIGTVGGGFKWGNSEGRSSTYVQTHTVASGCDDCLIELYYDVDLVEYYYFILEEKREVKKDKGGNVTGYSNYRYIEHYDDSFNFEFFDVSSAVAGTNYIPC